MKFDKIDTAVVMIDPQNEVLSETGRSRLVGTLCLRREQKALSPVAGERAIAVGTCINCRPGHRRVLGS
jgi:hypothetical protein